MNLSSEEKQWECQAQASYRLPGEEFSYAPHRPQQQNHEHPQKSPLCIQYVRNPSDQSILLDHKGNPVTVDRLLATKPLQSELSTRPGPGNRKMLYLSGDAVTRTLNDIFGYRGWNLTILNVQLADKQQQNQKYHVTYTAHVRITIISNGGTLSSYREDYGAGDAIDKSLATALAHALKASITDGMKRAARHFGDKLGNSLYQGSFNLRKAPVSLKNALDLYDTERARDKFGVVPKQQDPKVNPNHPSTSTTTPSEGTSRTSAGQVSTNCASAPQHPAAATSDKPQPERKVPDTTATILSSVTATTTASILKPPNSVHYHDVTSKPQASKPVILPTNGYGGGVTPVPFKPSLAPPNPNNTSHPAVTPATLGPLSAHLRLPSENVRPLKPSEALATTLFRPESAHGVRKSPSDLGQHAKRAKLSNPYG